MQLFRIQDLFRKKKFFLGGGDTYLLFMGKGSDKFFYVAFAIRVAKLLSSHCMEKI